MCTSSLSRSISIKVMEKGADAGVAEGAEADVPLELAFKDASARGIYNVADYAETLSVYGQRVITEENDSKKDPTACIFSRAIRCGTGSLKKLVSGFSLR